MKEVYMSEHLHATDSQKAIFDEALASLVSLDKLYIDDSNAVVSQRRMHEDQIARSKEALEVLNEHATTRSNELLTYRKEIARAAFTLYNKYPEVADDRERAFSLAVQIDQGVGMDEGEIANAVRSLLTLDDAVNNNQLILQCINGQFEKLIIPQPEAAGLSLRVIEDSYRISGVGIWFDIPTRTQVTFSANTISLPRMETNLVEPLYFTSLKPRADNSRPIRAATIMTDYEVSKGIRKNENKDNSTPETETAYIIGKELIQKAIESSSESDWLKATNTEFAYQAWLAGKITNNEFRCDLETIKEYIIKSASSMIEDIAKGYSSLSNSEINSNITAILMDAINKLGAEEQLFEVFASRLAKQGVGIHSIYKDPSIARTIFDAVIKKTYEPQ